MHAVSLSLFRAFFRSSRLSFVYPNVLARFSSAGCHQVQFYTRPRQEERYRALAQRYRRKLRAVHNKFTDSPDHTVIQGRLHTYTEDGGVICRHQHGSGVFEPEKVLSVEWLRRTEQSEREEGREERDEKEEEGTLQRVRLSPGERLLAATVKTPHQEEAKCIVVHLADTALPHTPLLIMDNIFSFEWASDSTLFYTKQEGLRCGSVHRLDLAEGAITSTLVYQEHDPEYFVEVGRSGDGQLLTLNCTSKSSSEVRTICCSTPDHTPTLVQPRQPGLIYYIEHARGDLYILANTGPGQEYQLVKAPVSSPGMGNWVPVFQPSTGWVIKDMELLRHHCVFTLRHPSGRLLLQSFPLQDPSCVMTVELPKWACAFESQRTSHMDRSSIHFLLSSPVYPATAYLYTPSSSSCLSSSSSSSSRSSSISSSASPPPSSFPSTPSSPSLSSSPPQSPSSCFSPSSSLRCLGKHRHRSNQHFHTTRLQANSKDGTKVPITLFHKKAMADLRSVSMLVHVYGAYGLELNMAFSPEKRLLLERGWALAYCHVRGGGEGGLAWARSGRLEGKQRGVEDLAACIQTLHQMGVATPNHTALTARSAGAVLVGALCNQQPQLIRAVTLQAPFLDVLGTMQDPSLPLTIEERGEWGNPLSSTQHRDNIASYCPCCNITPQLYPSMLITAYRDDSRVALAGVEKYVAKLRAAIHAHSRHNTLKPEAHVVLDLQPGGDHFGPEDFELSLCEGARQMAFLHMELGLDLPLDHENQRG